MDNYKSTDREFGYNLRRDSSTQMIVHEETKQLLNSIKSDLKTIFIVSELVITDEEIEGLQFDSATIQVTAKEGIICKRCWQVVDEVNEDGICDRCERVVEKLEEK